jgi:uncharacterized membrane protein YjjP (DUF1212 family)
VKRAQGSRSSRWTLALLVGVAAIGVAALVGRSWQEQEEW